MRINRQGDHLLPVRLKTTLLGAMILLAALSGCQPTSQSAGISALSQSFLPSPTPAPISSVTQPEASESPIPAPTATPSESSIPAASPSPAATACQESKGTILRQEVKSASLKDPLKIRLYLPPCFSDHPDEPYPLLILLHGSIFTDDQWDRLGIDETADRLITAGEIRPLLIAMPFEEQTLTNPYQAGFGLALADDLIPWLETQFPVCRERACRAIGGISRGASWAVHLGFTDWKLFGSIGAHSLPPFWGDLNTLPLWLTSIPKDQRPRVFVDVGRDDPYREPASQFEQFLTDNLIPHEWYLYTGGHDETYWSSHVEQYLRWYSAAWPLE
jgi:enterochelin esterase-like enzyme